MNFLDVICLIKERWFLSWLIIITILYIILSKIVDSTITWSTIGAYSLIHLILVAFVYNDQCKKFKRDKQKQECRDQFGDFVSDNK